MIEYYIDNSVKGAYLRVIPSIKHGNNSYEIIDFSVPKEHQRKGIGRGLLKNATRAADDEGVTLYALPDPPYCYTEKERDKRRNWLINLYKTFGFEFKISEGIGEMTREPSPDMMSMVKLDKSIGESPDLWLRLAAQDYVTYLQDIVDLLIFTK